MTIPFEDRPSCVGGILFADVVGSSDLRGEDAWSEFIDQFLGAVGAFTDQSANLPLVRNTWGDGLYFVFPDVRSVGVYALGLCRIVRETNWHEHGLPDMSVRVAVHAGPIYEFRDGVTHQQTWSGKQVVRAARMEPITPPGAVYASREFAAVSAALGVSEFYCEPVGRVRLDKREGMAPIFIVRGRQ